MALACACLGCGAFFWCLLCSYTTGNALLGHLVPLPLSTEPPLLCGLCFWDISAGLLCTTACPVRMPALFLLLPAPVLWFVHLGLHLTPVCALGWFCASACAWP